MSGRKANGRGRGRGRGGQNRSNNERSNNNERSSSMRDEEILIAFMPYLRSNNPQAMQIHNDAANNERVFLRAARDFLEREQSSNAARVASIATSSSNNIIIDVDNNQTGSSNNNNNKTSLLLPVQSKPVDPSLLFASANNLQEEDNNNVTANGGNTARSPTNYIQQQQQHQNHSPFYQQQQQQNSNNNYFSHSNNNNNNNHHQSSTDNLQSITRGLDSLLVDDDDPIVPIPKHQHSIINNGNHIRAPITPPRQAVSPWLQDTPFSHQQQQQQQQQLSPLQSPIFHQQQQQHQQQQYSTPTYILPSTNSQQLGNTTEINTLINSVTNTTSPKSGNSILSHNTPMTPARSPMKTPEVSTLTAVTTATKKAVPKRVWTRIEEQPGCILVNGVTGDDVCNVYPLSPREELTAYWILPLSYIRSFAQKQKEEQNNDGQQDAFSLQELLKHLTVGLFRRGCNENGSQASIISKCVLGDNNRSYEYWKDRKSDTVRGKVPFFSPRTPGHVVLRLYWDHQPVYTLGLGPTLLVRVSEADYEISMRFILSNFKARKSNPTSLSSLHSLSSVLETRLSHANDSAARATWGCLQEARKVLEVCSREYQQSTDDLATLEEEVNILKEQVTEMRQQQQQLEETLSHKSHDTSSLADGNDTHAISTVTSFGTDIDIDIDPELVALYREKTRLLMGGRASCERKWRDSQQAFANILKAVANNSTMAALMSRNLINKVKAELELWCPLSEEFAVVAPSDESLPSKSWLDSVRELPHVVGNEDFQRFAEARVQMQTRTLGFSPNVRRLDDILFPSRTSQRAIDPGAVGTFNSLSAAMGNYYQKLYANIDVATRKREAIRQLTERCVRESGAFPPETRVMIFGSSANNFGSPESDLDMCLQLPPGITLDDDDEENGSISMTKLASYMEKFGMKDVDSSRLTARIPIIKYYCPNSNGESEEFVECDLSMHNPLALVNTALLRTYAEITPMTRVLAAVVKRWAKARDINNPARHTLSSYGYLIMLIHFLTFHKRSGNGLLSPICPAEGSKDKVRDEQGRRQSVPQPLPLLPNLQWMDPSWLNLPNGTPYRDQPTLPKDVIKHPMDNNKDVNVYFYKPRTPEERTTLQQQFPGQDLSLAILLASFFRYYAYEFDYKNHIVSLHSTFAQGIMHREVKAELECWRNYSAALTIEDPFEVGYDVAHVLRGGYFHRIKREFTIAYSKLADAACGRLDKWDINNKSNNESFNGEDLLNWICQPVQESGKKEGKEL